MSWFAQSIANSLRLDDDDHSKSNENVEREKVEQHHHIYSSSSSPSTQGRGVKEDLSELSRTVTRQLWGVASFLAPPPADDSSPPPNASNSSPREHTDSAETSDPEVSDSVGISGIRSDFAEIGGKFRSGICKLSNNIAVSEITKIASNLLQLGSDQEDYDSVVGAVGVTEEVVAFARDIAMYPETWSNFPLPDDDDADGKSTPTLQRNTNTSSLWLNGTFQSILMDAIELLASFSAKLPSHLYHRTLSLHYNFIGCLYFDMSDAQQEHALAVERLAPRLAALRIELCPGYMSEGCFWKIYFVLLHPRLNKLVAELLSTPPENDSGVFHLNHICNDTDVPFYHFLEIVKARALLTRDLQNQTNAKPEQDVSGMGTSYSKDASNSPHEESLSVPSSVQSESIPLDTSAIQTATSQVAEDREAPNPKY